MSKQWCYFLFLVWISYLMVSSILLFTHGFLLSRNTQPNNSSCVSYKDIPCSQDNSFISNSSGSRAYQCTKEDKYASLLSNINSASSICLPPKAKVVLLIIDAFRYDFALFNSSLQEPMPFQNKLPVIHDILNKYPDRSRLFQFIADPPTTTMQRLKALTTGSLPTFIDAGSNFATSEINEDNIIDQLVKENHNIVFLGDDTWKGLYPNRFKRTYAYPSFNVWDLDTVDNGVKTYLYPELQKDDWSLLIGHFLGVDHCGHRYGPNHPEMERKLTEMNDVIRKVSKGIEDDTILFVIGDHGMTNTGDHGGESFDEVTAAMFMYSKRPLVTMPRSKEKSNVVKQVDLVPTLASILGVPIPYSNLGITILEVLPIQNLSAQGISDWRDSLFALWANVQQLNSYIRQYAKDSNIFNVEKLEEFYNKYNILNARLYTMSSMNEFLQFADDCKEFMTALRMMCEEAWIQFDSFSMSRGLLLMFLVIFFVYMIVDGIPIDRLPEIFMSSFLLCSYLTLLATTGICAICFSFNYMDLLLPNIYFANGIVSIFMLVMLIVQNWEIIAINWYSLSKMRNWTHFLCRIILLLSVCIMFSNSFIVEEAKTLMFLLISLVIIIVFEVNKTPKSNKTKIEKVTVPFRKTLKAKAVLIAVVICLLIRISINYLRCREEQQWCTSATHNIWKPGGQASKAEWIITLFSLALLVTFSRIWLRSCGNLVGHSPTVFLARYSPTVLVVCIGGYWVLHRLPKDTKNKLFGPWQADMLAWVVYGFVLLGILSAILKPLCIYILPKTNEYTVENSDNIIPQLFRQVKGMFSDKTSEHDEVPIVCGLATVYSTVFIIISVYLTLLLALLLGDAIAPSAVIMFFSAAFILVISSLSRYEKASNIEEVFNIPSSSLLSWFILSLYFFYATGHQPTFPNIAWEAAFVGTGGEFKYNFIPGLLIIWNTFGSQILFGVTLPLLLIAPFSLFVIMHSWIKRNDQNKDFSRGDILIYENESLVLNHAFTLSCKYILCHGIRVFASMLTATIHCRHLMVWAIFAPKLIFESIGLMVTIASVMVGYLLLVRVNYKVNRLINCLNNQHR